MVWEHVLRGRERGGGGGEGLHPFHLLGVEKGEGGGEEAGRIGKKQRRQWGVIEIVILILLRMRIVLLSIGVLEVRCGEAERELGAMEGRREREVCGGEEGVGRKRRRAGVVPSVVVFDDDVVGEQDVSGGDLLGSRECVWGSSGHDIYQKMLSCNN